MLSATVVTRQENLLGNTLITLSPDVFTKHAGNVICGLATPALIDKQGYPFANRTESTIAIAKNTILANVNTSTAEPVYGIVDLVKYQTFMAKGCFEPPPGVRTDPVQATCMHATVRPVEQDDMKRAKELKRMVLKSKYAGTLATDDENLLHRLLLVDKHVVLDKGILTEHEQAEMKLIIMAYCDMISLGIDDLP